MSSKLLEEYLEEKLNIKNKDAVNSSIDSIKFYYDKFVDITQSADDQAIGLFDNFDFRTLLYNCNNFSSRHVPYSKITDLVFKEEKEYSSEEMQEIATFPGLFKGAFLEWLESKYSKGDVTKDITKEEIYEIKEGGETKSIEEKFNLDDIDKYIDGIENIYKIIEHLELAIKQKQGLYDKQSLTITKLNEDINRNKKTVARFEKSIEKVANMKESIKGVYPQFVAILGIFTSIMFAVLGGFNEMKTLAQSMTSVPIPKLLIFTALLMLGINFLVFLSYNAISKLTNLPIKSCCNNKICNCTFKEKHPTVFYSSLFFIYIMFIGFALRLYKYNDFSMRQMFDDLNNTDLLPLYLILVPPIIYCFYKLSQISYKDRFNEWQRNREKNKNSKKTARF